MHYWSAAIATLAVLSTTTIAAPHAMRARYQDMHPKSREARGYFEHVVTSINFPGAGSFNGTKTSHVFEHILSWNEPEAVETHKLAEYLYNLTVSHGTKGMKNGSEATPFGHEEGLWEKFFDALEDKDEQKTHKYHQTKNGGDLWKKVKRYDELPKDPEEKKPIDTSNIWGKIKAKNEEWGNKYEAWEIKALEKYLGNDKDLCKDPDYEPELRLGHDPRCPHYYDNKDKKKSGDKDNGRKESIGNKSKGDEKKDGKKTRDNSPDHKASLGEKSKGDEKKDGKKYEGKKLDRKESLTNTPKDDGKKDNNDSGEKPADHKESLEDKANGVEH